MHSYTVTVSEMGMTETERSSLKLEHPDKAGECLVTAGMQQLEEQRANLCCQWVDRSTSSSHVGISEMQELPGLSLSCFVICTSPVFTLATSGLQCSATEKKKTEKKNKKSKENENN